MRLKASQRRTLKHAHGVPPGGRRPKQKPLKLRDQKESFSGLGQTLRLCKSCEQLQDPAAFEFVRRDGTLSQSRFAWCDACRAAVTEASCASCRETKPREAFYAQPARSIGLSSYCVDCTAKSAEESARKFKSLRQEMSDAELVRTKGVEPGRCIAFVNVGAFTVRGVRCSRAAAVGNKCLMHASSDERRIGSALSRIRVGTEQFGSRRWRQEYERRQQAELSTLNAELAALVAEQSKDSRINQMGLPWQVSLDKRFGDDNESTLLDFVDHGGRFAFGQSHTPDFSDAVCAVVDRRREIDQWAEDIAA